MEVQEDGLGFDSFGFKENILKGIQEAGFKVPSPIQQKSIPVILQGFDVIGQAHTGTGKTAAFGLPAMNMMKGEQGVEMLVIVPTRELATQVSDEIFRLGRFADIHTGTVVGGQGYARQIKMLDRGIQVLVATPGRLIDLLKSEKIHKFKPKMVVLDEADEMLDMGFLDDIKEIFTFLPSERQTLLFSATMPKPIQELAKKILKNPITIKTIDEKDGTNSDIRQLYYIMQDSEREDALVRLIDEQDPQKAIVFCRTKMEVDDLTMTLIARGVSANSLHGDLVQARRNEVMAGFRKGSFDVLIATDVAARGLDVADVSHVFNFHMPFDPKSYIHRIGRTGRAGAVGTAITLITPREYRQLERIKQNVGAKMEYRVIPPLEQIRKARLDRIYEHMKTIKIEPDVQTFIESVQENTDIKDFANRLVTYILGDKTEDGPETIGLTEVQYQKLSHKEPKQKKAQGKGKEREYHKKFPNNQYGKYKGNEQEKSGSRHKGKSNDSKFKDSSRFGQSYKIKQPSKSQYKKSNKDRSES